MTALVDVTDVEVLGDHRLRLTFEDGVVGDVDFAKKTWRGVFEPLRDPGYFASVRVDSASGTLVWPNGVDMAPEPLYEQARAHPAQSPPPLVVMWATVTWQTSSLPGQVLRIAGSANPRIHATGSVPPEQTRSAVALQ